ncbi:Uncharacterized conserved secreted protein [Synechococcus sp. RCC307]|nr:Uncharacterized conserved secreted protein [Synechococcus sp. RCC307]
MACGLGLAGPTTLQAHAHGDGEGEELEPGEFRARPVITIEGHGGFENNLEGRPQHYAIDGLFGGVLEWGLENGGSLAIEAQVGPAAVWGEAEHFYGLVHIEEHEDDHHEEEEGHDEHAEEEHEDHGHSSGSPYRRTDVKGYLQVRYEPNEQLAFSAMWKPYYVTEDQGEDIKGFKHEMEFGAIYAFGDGDVNFALGDGLESIVDGIFISAKNATGWESDNTYVGNYTDVWPGFGFNYDKLNVTLSGGPRFYSPGSYAKLPSRTDWGGEIALEYPLSKNTVLFAHWEPMYSTQGGEGWGKGFQHHVGSGVTFSF